jgi:Flp pilus assembly protein TadD
MKSEEVFGLDRETRLAGAQGTPSSATQDLLIKARDLYQAGRDDEALPELHRVVMIEPTNAEAYLLSGRINLRRSDQEAAIAALKTARQDLSRSRRPRRGAEVRAERHHHRPQ